MKRETLRHPKTLDLMGRLGCTRPEALGYLTLLWDYTGEIALQGDLGKWPNNVIAQACDWSGDADEFVNALVAARWVDEVDGEARLIIHDWPDHVQDWVRAKLKRAGLSFAPEYDRSPGASVYKRRKSGRSDAVATPSLHRSDNVVPIRTEPNQTKPNQEGVPPGEAFEGFRVQWNATPGVRRCLKATPPRLAAFRARCRDPDWLKQIDAALAKVANSKFCQGENDRGWKMDLDFLLKPDTITKILEGKYDDRKNNNRRALRPNDSPARIR